MASDNFSEAFHNVSFLANVLSSNLTSYKESSARGGHFGDLLLIWGCGGGK